MALDVSTTGGYNQGIYDRVYEQSFIFDKTFTMSEIIAWSDPTEGPENTSTYPVGLDIYTASSGDNLHLIDIRAGEHPGSRLAHIQYPADDGYTYEVRYVLPTPLLVAAGTPLWFTFYQFTGGNTRGDTHLLVSGIIYNNLSNNGLRVEGNYSLGTTVYYNRTLKMTFSGSEFNSWETYVAVPDDQVWQATSVA
jgi:hypothetical protein